MSKKKIFLVLFLFLLLLTSFRLIWFAAFIIPPAPKVQEGVLDMREVDLKGKTMFLEDQWFFYPNQRINPQQLAEQDLGAARERDSEIKNGNDIQRKYFKNGTLHLRILTDPKDHHTYRFRFMGIQFQHMGDKSSAVIFVNGSKVKEIRQSNVNKEKRSFRDQPFSVPAQAKDGQLDLVIQVSDFSYPPFGGIMKGIHFGTAQAVQKQETISISMQLIAFAILLFHAIYVALIYLFVLRRKVILLFAAAFVCTALTIIVADDKIIVSLFPTMSWDERIKLSYLLYPGAMIFLLYYLKTFVPDKFNRTFHLFQILSLVYAVIVIAVPFVTAYPVTNPFFRLIMLVPTVLIPIIFFQIVRKGVEHSIFLLLVAVAVGSNIMWASLKNQIEGIGAPYYPFDFLIAVICFALFWFKRFYHTLQTKEHLNKKLIQVDKIKDEFLANTSHELRNPLHAMINIAQSLLDDPDQSLTIESKKQIEMLAVVARKMSFVVNDLTDVSQLKESRVQLKQRPIHLQALVTGVFNVLSFSKNGKQIEFFCKIPESFPLVEADEQRVMQILFNLLHNALKYTNKGFISVSAQRHGQQAVISVEDTGIGMDEETQKRIFMPYEQGRTTSTVGGLGLGLSICAQLIQLHGGNIHVQSSLGKGSIFTFSLPISMETGKPTPNIISVQPVSDFSIAEVESSQNDSMILLVDDDSVNLSVFSQMLRQKGYAVTTCVNGEEALQKLHSQKWSLIISDVMMPGMSGYELTTKIRKRFSHSELPILLLTARQQPEDSQAGFQAGANDYVVKPVEKVELLARVDALVQLKESIKKQARVEAALLQAQIQPHFLYNTLNTIAALSEIDPEKMIKLLHEFGNYLRKSFDRENLQETISLNQELDLVRSYLYIEQQRFGERLVVHWNKEKNISAKVPPLSIQTLVENAIKHGMDGQYEGITVSLTIQKTGQRLKVSIADNGAGIQKEQLDHLRTYTEHVIGGIGLINTNKRLQQLYGTGLSIESTYGEGTIVSFVVPTDPRILKK